MLGRIPFGQKSRRRRNASDFVTAATGQKDILMRALVGIIPRPFLTQLPATLAKRSKLLAKRSKSGSVPAEGVLGSFAGAAWVAVLARAALQ
jgi:hypothetical protein